MKEPGIGREGSHYGVDVFIAVKYLCMGASLKRATDPPHRCALA